MRKRKANYPMSYVNYRLGGNAERIYPTELLEAKRLALMISRRLKETK